MSDQEVDETEKQVARCKPEGLDALCRTTKFTRKELQIMYRGFKNVSGHSISDGQIQITCPSLLSTVNFCTEKCDTN